MVYVTDLIQIVQEVDSAIHPINHYPAKRDWNLDRVLPDLMPISFRL